MRGLRWAFGVVVVVGCVLGALGAGPALAAPSSFGGGEGEEAGQFRSPHGIAVEQESGDVYVADTSNERIDKFGAGGEFLFAWGWGVADGHSEAPQTCTTSCSTGVYGGGGGELRFPEGVAVDNDPLSASHGDVYVMDSANNRVEKFDSSGAFLLAFGWEVNATTSGNVCLAGEACRAGVSGTEPGQFAMGETGGIAVDPSGNVFVGDVNRVEEFSPAGVYVGEIAVPEVESVRALAVDGSGDVYVKDSKLLTGVREYDSTGTEVGAPRDAAGAFDYGSRGFLTLGASGELFAAEYSNTDGVVHIGEFDAAGSEVASFDRGTEGGLHGIAFNVTAGALDVMGSGGVSVVSPSAPGPLVVSASAGELQPTTVSVSGLVNPEGHETSYHVEYGTTIAYGSSSTPGTLGGSEFEDEPVSFELSGLQSRTTYHFRVVASNSAGTTFGEDETFTTLPPALIDSESVAGVTAASATLGGEVNPLGRSTTYRFEYGPSTAYGTSVPAPDGDAGSGTSDVALSALVEQLTPGTVYHYRLVVSNALGTVVGPDRVFTTQSGETPVLPDGRAWEMVSPPDKGGYALDGIGAYGGADIQAAADGGAVTYMAHGPVGGEPKGNRSIAHTQVFSSRTAAGWSSLDIATPNEAVEGTETTRYSEYQVFSPDLSVGLFEPTGDTPLAPSATEKTPYLREANGEYVPLVTAGNTPPGTKFGQVKEGGEEVEGDVVFAGASPDLGHVVLKSVPPLTEGIADTEGRGNLFEWFGGSLRLVSVMPNGVMANGKAATEEGFTANLGFSGLTSGGNVRHAVSDDGSRVIWDAQEVGGVHSRSLYLRDMRMSETVRLDAVQPGAQGGNGQPKFALASSDGSKVFFTDDSRLTADSTARKSRDLYMCEVVEVAGRLACRLKDLSVDHNPGESADVQDTVIGAGGDGRYVYFVASGVLAAGATPENCERKEERAACSLYVYDTVAGDVRFIARLSGADYPDWYAYDGTLLSELTAGVSPDGRYLAFMSERSLTGYDNSDTRSGQPDEEVFLYDAVTGGVTCASCNPSGARPSGVFDAGGVPGLLVDRRNNWQKHWLAGSLPGWTEVVGPFSYRSRYLSDSGRLFFDSADALVPQDGNGKGDVYEYEPGGVGGCVKAEGCVGLISSGTSGGESAFVDASESGNDVFFLTAARLVAQDLDRALDVYDARVCSTSSPCLAALPAPPAPCGTADSCRAALSSQPGVFGAPPSATFSGAGNPVPGVSKAVAKKRVLSVARRRATALHKCRAKPRRRRVSCEAQARRRYRVGVKAKLVVRSSPMRKGNR